MWKESKELEEMYNKFAPYLVEQPDGTADFLQVHLKNFETCVKNMIDVHWKSKLRQENNRE